MVGHGVGRADGDSETHRPIVRFDDTPGRSKEGVEVYPGAHAATDAQRPAIVMAATGESVSFAELDEQANRLSHVFHDLGLRPGDHVAFCLENRAEFLAVCWGAHYAGLVYTAVSTRLTRPS